MKKVKWKMRHGPWYRLRGGFNTYWLMEFAVDQLTRGKVNEVFQQASSIGLMVCRSWAFNDGQGQALQKSPSVYDEEVFKTVLNRVNSLTNITYIDDPTIFAWELMNGPRCDGNRSGDKIQHGLKKWQSTQKASIQSIYLRLDWKDFMVPQHLTGFDTTLIGTDFIRNHQDLGVDFASTHIYAHAWISRTISESRIPFFKSCMQVRMEDAENALHMPVVFGEFGVSAKDRGYNSLFRDAFIVVVYDTLINSTKRGGSGGGSLLWQLFPEGTDSMDDG